MRSDDDAKCSGTAKRILVNARPAVEPSTEAPASGPANQTARAITDTAAAFVDGLSCRMVPRARRVFVNRNLRLDMVEVVGFDMDYTLAVYHYRRLESLAYRMTVDSLVTRKGYPEAVRGLTYQPDSVIRGLVIDKDLGNIFKMDRHYHVARVHHGRRPLTKEERIRWYRRQKIRPGSKRYVWVDTLFALPEAALYADLVSFFDSKVRDAGGSKVDYSRLYDDVRDAIDTVHRDGSLKKVVREDLDYYVRREPELGPTLHRMRSSGKKLFLLTNSQWDYTDALMSFLLDGLLPEYPSWRGYFDLILVGANKPDFFGEGGPFREVDTKTGSLGADTGQLKRGAVYEGGNLRDLEKATRWEGDKVLYVGDHIYGDILRTKRSGMWRTAMVVQEVEAEVEYLQVRREDLGLVRRMESLRVRIDDEMAQHKAAVSELEKRILGRAPQGPVTPLPTEDLELADLQRRQRHARAHLDKLRRHLKQLLAGIQELGNDLHDAMNPSWGMVFKEGHENSRFAEQVEAYACVYTARVSNFLSYSPGRYFRSTPSRMPHEVEDFREGEVECEELPDLASGGGGQ